MYDKEVYREPTQVEVQQVFQYEALPTRTPKQNNWRDFLFGIVAIGSISLYLQIPTSNGANRQDCIDANSQETFLYSVGD